MDVLGTLGVVFPFGRLLQQLGIYDLNQLLFLEGAWRAILALVGLRLAGKARRLCKAGGVEAPLLVRYLFWHSVANAVLAILVPLYLWSLYAASPTGDISRVDFPSVVTQIFSDTARIP